MSHRNPHGPAVAKPAAARAPSPAAAAQPVRADDLSRFCCPNPDCMHFQQFVQGNLRVAELMGKDKRLRRLVCRTCQTRFSELQGTLLEYGHIPEEKVVQILKCLTYGNSVEATADIVGVDPRTVQRIVDRGGERAKRFHDQKVQGVQAQQVQMDEVYSAGGKKKAAAGRSLDLHRHGGLLAAVARGLRRATRR